MAGEAELGGLAGVSGAGASMGSVGASSAPPGDSGLAQATPVAAPAAVSTPSASPGGLGAGAGTATAAAAQPGSAEWVSVRDALAGYGIDLRPQFQDDHSALQHLALAYRQAQQGSQLSEYGRLYLQHAEPFQAWMRSQQEAAQQKQAQQQGWWKAPDYDPSWLSKLTRDPQTGELRALPGSDPSIVQKYLAWQDHQRGFLERFSKDPMEAIKPGVEQIARQIAQDMVQQHLGGYQQRSQANDFVAQNSSWLHARDQQGQLLGDPRTGKPALSPLGQQFAGFVREAEQRGINDVAGQQDYALTKVQRNYLLTQFTSGQQGQSNLAQGEAQKQAFLAAAQNAANGNGQGGGQRETPPNVNGGLPPAQGLGNKRALEEMMLKEMAAGGFQAGQKLF